jgi:hypothetical protein
VRFEVLRARSMKIAVFWVVATIQNTASLTKNLSIVRLLLSLEIQSSITNNKNICRECLNIESRNPV